MNHSSEKIVEDYEILLNEFNVLRRKLDSKVQALLILSKELDQCRIERDQYRILTEQLRDRYCSRRRSVEGKSIIQLMCEMKEQNKNLQTEAVDLKQKLMDSQGDIKLLREQMARKRLDGYDERSSIRQFTSHEREALITRLESLKIKNSMLERDLQSVFDEKEELINERDSYKQKVERLNHELNYVLKGDDKRIIDVDALVMENRYLQERLKQIQEEKSLYLQTLSKYKSMLEKRRNQCGMKMGSNGNGGVIITHKQVQLMLQTTNLSQLPTTQTTIADLRSLALALFESLNDKNIALAHQKKANRILGTRITELEQKLKKNEITLPVQTNQDLMYIEHEDTPPMLTNVCSPDNQRINEDKTMPTSLSDAVVNKSVPDTSNANCISMLNDDRSTEQIRSNSSDSTDIEADDSNCQTVPTSDRLPIEMTCDSGVGGDERKETSEELPPTLLKLVRQALENLDKEEK